MRDTHILIVDDEEDLREVLSYELQSLGARIHFAENGRRALEQLKSQWFDAVLSDISMPEMTGLELLAEIRALGYFVPFVILTGFGDKTKAVEALRLGAFDFMEKPWNSEQLNRTVGLAIEMGYRLRSLEDELEAILKRFKNIPPEELTKVRELQKAILLLRLQKSVIGKKSG